MSQVPVVRFAPSPTGYLHIGGARTALFNYLFARHHGGKFLLRIEDTDRERSTPEAVAAILEGLQWLGIQWDGDIYFQTSVIARHREAAERLLAKGAAYRCFCTPDSKRNSSSPEKKSFIYDRTCLKLDPEESRRMAESGRQFALRFLIGAGTTQYDDLVHGIVKFENREIEDFVILRSDGSPTYQLAAVVDDIYMGITHIIRGDDHVSNTPKQIMLYRALGAGVPRFAHVPLILGPDKNRLSKRHGATSLTDYRALGFLSDALFNFLALLGWSPGDDREILSREELVRIFTLEGISKKNAVFDQAKLEWMNGRYISGMAPQKILKLVEDKFKAGKLLSQNAGTQETEYLLKVLDLVKERCRLTGDFLPRSRFFFPVELDYDPQAVEKYWKSGTDKLMYALREELRRIDDWKAEPLEASLRTLAEKLHISAAKMIHPLRLALTGQSVSPGIFETMSLMGRDLTISRLDKALSLFSGK